MPAIRIESPFPPAAWPRVWSWIEDFRSRVADDYGPKTLPEFVSQQLAAEHRTWAVYRDAELCGAIKYEQGKGETGEAHALFRKDFWGKGTAKQACRMVYGTLFAEGVHKIMMTPFRDNHAMIAVAGQLGFQKEGILREHTKRGGLYVDMVVMGLTKGDFDKCLGAL